jgi:hypothetical protein
VQERKIWRGERAIERGGRNRRELELANRSERGGEKDSIIIY